VLEKYPYVARVAPAFFTKKGLEDQPFLMKIHEKSNQLAMA
jgi:hypothetical protein